MKKKNTCWAMLFTNVYPNRNKSLQWKLTRITNLLSLGFSGTRIIDEYRFRYVLSTLRQYRANTSRYSTHSVSCCRPFYSTLPCCPVLHYITFYLLFIRLLSLCIGHLPMTIILYTYIHISYIERLLVRFVTVTPVAYSSQIVNE